MSPRDELSTALSREWTHLSERWEDAQTKWRDEVAADFGKRFMSPWETDVAKCLSTLRKLEAQLQAARRELT